MTDNFVMTEEQIKAILEDAQEDIAKSLVEEAKISVARELRYKMDNELSTIVKEFFATDIAPEIRAHLIANKSVILNAALSSSTELAQIIQVALIKTLEENMSKSWSRKKIFETMFE